MHDIDPTKDELEDELGALEADELGYEFEFEDEDEDEFEGVFGESPFTEEEEEELVAELLEITTEEELEQFLGKLFKKVKRGFKKFARSKVGRALGGVLKKVAKVGLPLAGKAVGTFFGGPVGGMVGGKLGSAATKLFGLEFEDLDPEDAEFEVARRFIRLAGTAAQHARADAPDAQGEVQRAMKKAAKAHAPGLIKSGKVSIPSSRSAITKSGPRGERSGVRKSGRWVRRGNKITLLGI